MEAHIQRDPALTAQVLRVVNSAYYGLSGQIASVGQAIVILGVQQVRNLALSVGAIGTLSGRGQAEIDAAKRFWHHSAAVSAGVQILISRVPMTSTETDVVRVAGLIHDLGRLCVMCSFSDLYESVIQCAEEEQIPVEAAEMRVLGLTHADVGRQIAEHWKLPPMLTEYIGRHEGPFNSNDPVSLYALNLADTLSKAAYFPNRNLEVPVVSPVVMARLGLTEEQVEEIRAEMEARASQVGETVGMAA